MAKRARRGRKPTNRTVFTALYRDSTQDPWQSSSSDFHATAIDARNCCGMDDDSPNRAIGEFVIVAVHRPMVAMKVIKQVAADFLAAE